MTGRYAEMRSPALGLKRFEACTSNGEYLVGSHGDGLCSASLRTGEIIFSSRDAESDPKKRIVDAVSHGDSTLSVSADGVLSQWTVDADGRCVLGRRQTPAIGGSSLLAVACSSKKCFVLWRYGPDSARREGSRKRKVSDARDSTVIKGSPLELVCWSLANETLEFVVDGALPTKADRPAKGGLACVDIAREDGTMTTVLVLCCKRLLRVYSVDDSSASLVAATKLAEDPAAALSLAGGDEDSFLLVTGHTSGVVRVWNQALSCFSSTPATSSTKKKKNSVASLGTYASLHWHASKVGAVCASSTGTYVLSGGSEAVLVVWQLARNDKEDKTTLPRLGAPLVEIVEAFNPVDGAPLAVVVTADNAIHVVAVTQDLARLWSHRGLCIVAPPRAVPGLQRLQSKERTFARRRRAFVALERSQKVAVNTRAGTLDVYDPSLDRVVSSLDVVPHNRIFSVTAQAQREPAVLLAQFSKDLEWLATVDAWVPTDGSEEYDDDDEDDLQELKLWKRSSSTYALDAVVRAPHAKNGVAALRFGPKNTIVASVGVDGSFKTWIRSSKGEWSCGFAAAGVDPRAVAHKGDPAYRDAAVDICSDGSVAAVGHSDNVTLWDLMENSLMMSLSSFEGGTTSLRFGPQSGLLAVSRRGISFWDLQKDDRDYEIRVESSAADVNASGTVVAVAPVGSRSVVLFSHDDPEKPIGRFPIKGKADPRSLVFLGDDNILVFKDSHLVHLVRNETTADNDEENRNGSSATTLSATRATRLPGLGGDVVVHKDGDMPELTTNLLRDLSAGLLAPAPVFPEDAEEANSVELMFDNFLKAQFRVSRTAT